MYHAEAEMNQSLVKLYFILLLILFRFGLVHCLQSNTTTTNTTTACVSNVELTDDVRRRVR